jgi:hypothetical protein
MNCECCGKDDPTVKTCRLTDTGHGKVKLPLLCDGCFDKIHDRSPRDLKFATWLELTIRRLANDAEVGDLAAEFVGELHALDSMTPEKIEAQTKSPNPRMDSGDGSGADRSAA